MDSPKYNRTLHMPWSKGTTNDDKIATSMELANFYGLDIVITEKMDGSNTSLEHNGCFARTHAGPPNHISFDGLKALHASIKFKIPKGIQLFGEWCYAKHSIEYTELPGYFMLFNVRELSKSGNIWLSWQEVELWAEEINVPTAPILWKGKVFSDKELITLTQSFMNKTSCCGGIREGVVARLASQFPENSFNSCVLKCVRADHVQTTTHWKDQEVIKNKLKL